MKINTQRLAVSIAALVGIVSCFLPWMRVAGIASVSAFSAGIWGWLTFLLFVAPIVISLMKDREQNLEHPMSLVVMITGGLPALIGLWNLISLLTAGGSDAEVAAFFGALVSPGFGLYLTIIAGIAIPVLVFLMKDKGTTSIGAKTESQPNNEA